MKKQTLRSALEFIVVLTAIVVASEQPAHAYLDPGSGSYALQIAIAGVMGALFSVKMFWSRIKESVSGRQNRDAVAAAAQKNSPETPSVSGE